MPPDGRPPERPGCLPFVTRHSDDEELLGAAALALGVFVALPRRG